MNKLTHDEYNQMVLENIDHHGSSSETECPNCHNNAFERSFEACHTGSVNQHVEINCTHCGYHECDVDECGICEQATAKSDDEYDALNLDVMFDCILEDLTCHRCIGVSWSSLKSEIYKNPKLVFWFHKLFINSTQAVTTPKQLIDFLLAKLLDFKTKVSVN